MKVTRQYEEVRCDMCDTDITEWGKYGIELKSINRDLCKNCKEKLQLALTFLTITVGYDIPYLWSEERE